MQFPSRDPKFRGFGTHWTLLVLVIKTGVYYLYDSLGGSSPTDLIYYGINLKNLAHAAGYTGEIPKIQSVDCPNQGSNGIDCALYVFQNIDCTWRQIQSDEFGQPITNYTQAQITKLRQNLANRMKELKQLYRIAKTLPSCTESSSEMDSQCEQV